jgi:hypothetical protein
MTSGTDGAVSSIPARSEFLIVADLDGDSVTHTADGKPLWRSYLRRVSARGHRLVCRLTAERGGWGPGGSHPGGLIIVVHGDLLPFLPSRHPTGTASRP